MRQVSSFSKVWTAREGGPDNLGASFYEPSPVPDGFFMLGSYAQPNNQPLFGWVLVAKDSSSGQILKMPIDYTLFWSSESLKMNQDGIVYIWLPVPPDGYTAVGHIITTSPTKPPLEKIRCVRADFTDVIENDEWIWGNSDTIFSVSKSRPKNRGTQGLGVSTGAFMAVNKSGVSSPAACLKNVHYNLSSMPNLNQINALVQHYSPVVYFHPDEQFLPSSVTWFFQNGALLYTKGQESNPTAIDSKDGSNLPQGGSNDGAYWLDLPTDNAAKDRVKKGDLSNAIAYLHIKPTFGATFTDIAMWIFYPFNGAAKAKVEFLTVSLGKIGEHVGDWEHVTLRFSNFNGELKSVYFSQHSRGTWVSSSELEFQSSNSNSNKFVVYSSLHGHAAYPRTGNNLQGNNGGNVGIINDAKKSKMVMDTGANYTILCVDYNNSNNSNNNIVVVGEEGAWLNYAREWGPKISYDINDELKKVERFLPGKLKSAFNKVVRGLPNEVLGEEGPTGPKWKDSWSGDETS